MSDRLTAAAASLGIPEDLARRSAEARATVTGSSVDDILAAWAGGSPAPSTAAAEEPGAVAKPVPSEPAESVSSAESVAQTGPVMEIPAAPPPIASEAPVSTGGKPPLLVGAPDNPMKVLVSALGLFLLMVLVGLVGPSLSVNTPGTRTSNIAHTEAGQSGETIYQSQGCGSCHTQMVRPIVSDVGLGPASLGDSNQVLGTRRFGPDLSTIGDRMTATQIEAVLDGGGDHPQFYLSPTDMDDLVTYLMESSAPVSG